MRQNKEVTLRSSDTLNAAQASTLQRMSEGQRATEPKISLGGKNNRLDFRMEAPAVMPRESIDLTTDSTQQGGSIFNSDFKFKQALPWGIALLCLAAAVFFAVKAYKYLKAQVPAVGLAFNTAEEIVAKRIGNWRDRNMTQSDPVKMAEDNAKIAELQRDLADMKQKKFDQTP